MSVVQHAVCLLLAKGKEQERAFIDVAKEPRRLAGEDSRAPLLESPLLGAP